MKAARFGAMSAGDLKDYLKNHPVPCIMAAGQIAGCDRPTPAADGGQILRHRPPPPGALDPCLGSLHLILP